MGLYPFQHEGAKWLVARPRAYLADVMGLGKTIQAIAALRSLNERAASVVCPASMVGTWEEEFATWYPEARPQIFSYNWLVRKMGVPACSTFIVDEAHYCKSPSAKRTKVVLDSLIGRKHKAWFLSGTPTPNGPHELYTIVSYCLPKTMKRLGIKEYRHWLNTFCQWYLGEYGPRITGPKNVALFRRLLFDTGFMLRRKFEDVGVELPKLDLRRFPLRVKSSAEITMLEDLYGEEVMNYVRAGELPPVVDSHIATLRRLVGEVKARYVGSMLHGEMSEGNHKLVVFGYHHSVLNELQKHLSSFGLVRLDGSSTPKQRDSARKRFQTDPTVRVFLGQIQASGVGITLTAASDIVITEPSWVPSENEQAIARVRRIGQSEGTVTARIMTIAGTLDDSLNGVVIQKQRTISSTID